MVSAKSDSANIQQALDAGANDYITKPVDFKTALSRINQHLKVKATSKALRSESERYAQEQEAKLSAIVEQSDFGVISVDQEGVIDTINPGACRIFCCEKEAVIGQNIKLFLPDSFDRIRDEYLQEHHLAHRKKVFGRNRELDAKRYDGTLFPIEIIISEINVNQKISYSVIVKDVTERIESEKKIRELALTDPLTGLANRNEFNAEFDHHLLEAQRTNKPLALLLLDLDHFKDINDAYGHLVGDQILKLVAESLKKTLRQADVIARLGGDEFAVLISEMDCKNSIVAPLERLLTEMSRPVEIDGLVMNVSATVGVSLYPGDGANAQELLRSADVALYRGKDLGRNRFCFYCSELGEQVEKRRAMVDAMRAALQSETGFELLYQPQIDLRTKQCVGVEALLRWRAENKDIHYPDEFIPVAEDTGMILELGEWVLQQALSDFDNINSFCELKPVVSVNVSAVEFREHAYVDRVLKKLSDSGVPAHSLCLEITETVLAEDIEQITENMQRLREAGVQISLDDFGTGYSSLSYLHKMPFDELKIDRSFIADLTVNPEANTLVKAIIGLGKNMKLRVVAEGGETEQQCEIIGQMGGDIMQGYFFAKPMTLAALCQWAENNKI